MPDINSLACGLSSQHRESVERRFVPQVAHFGDIGDEMSVPAANDNELAAEWPQVTTVSDSNSFSESGWEWTEQRETVTISRQREDESFIDDNQSIYPAELRPIILSEVGYLPVLDWGCAPTYGQLPQYWKYAYYEVVVTGLKVWQVDGKAWYMRTVIHSPPRRSRGNGVMDLPAEWDDPEWPYQAERHVEGLRWAGDAMNDGALLLFLLDHGCGDLWNVVMGMETPPANKREITVITLDP